MPDELVKVTIRLPDRLVTRAKIHAAKTKTTLQAIITEALTNHLKDGGK